MTNGEKIKEIFSDCFIVRRLSDNKIVHLVCTEEFLNSEYKEPTPKNDLGVDCIDRAQAQTEIEMNALRYTIAKERGGMGQVEWSDQLIKVSDAVNIIRKLPPVTPQERKGHWIDEGVYAEGHSEHAFMCSKCEKNYIGYARDLKWCPNCGSDNREVKE